MIRAKLSWTLLFLSFICFIHPLHAEWIDPAASSAPASGSPAPETKEPAPAISPKADEPELGAAPRKFRTFMSLEGFYSSVRGDFKGDRFVIAEDNSQTILIPKLKNGGGVAGRLGFRRVSSSAVDLGIEAGFGWSRHDVEQQGWNSKATLFSFDGNVLMYFNTPSPAVSPYISAGLSFPFLYISEAAFSATKNDSATYSGIGLNLGAGMEWMMGRHWALQAGVAYKWMSMTGVSGVDDKELKLEDPLHLSTFSPHVRLAWYF